MACCTMGPGTDGFATHHSEPTVPGDGVANGGGNTTGGMKLPPGGGTDPGGSGAFSGGPGTIPGGYGA